MWRWPYRLSDSWHLAQRIVFLSAHMYVRNVFGFLPQNSKYSVPV